MSKLIITPSSIEEILLYKDADCYLLGNEAFSVRYNHCFNANELRKAKEIIKSMNKEMFINVNKIFQETELDNLRGYLLFLKELEVDAILFSDFSVYQISKELGIENKCIMYHETYPLNTFDLEVILSFNLKGVIISKEVELDMLRNTSKFNNVGIVAFGHIEMFNSKRKLLETYSDEHNLNKDYVKSYNVKVKEMTRENLYPLYQDDNGTNIFTSFVYSVLKDFKELLSFNMEYFIIDTIFLDKDYSLNVLNIFNDLRNNKEVDLDKFYNESKYELGSGFLHTNVGLVK